MAANGHNQARPKQGAWSFLRVSHMGAWAQELKPSSVAFPVSKQGADLEAEQLGYNPVPYNLHKTDPRIDFCYTVELLSMVSEVSFTCN